MSDNTKLSPAHDVIVHREWDHPGLNELNKPLYTPGERGVKLPLDWPEQFLNELALTHNVSQSLRKAGVSRGTAYGWRKDNELFRALWDEALELAIDNLEARAYQRAMGLTAQGVGDDAMIRWFLARRRSDKYGDRQQVDLSSKDGSMTPQVAIFQLPDNGRDDVEKLEITDEVNEYK